MIHKMAGSACELDKALETSLELKQDVEGDALPATWQAFTDSKLGQHCLAAQQVDGVPTTSTFLPATPQACETRSRSLHLFWILAT